jgi:hypothetical protein
MGKLLKEAALDDKFNVQMGKIQDAISKLNDLVGQMTGMTKPVASQKLAVRHAAEDLKALLEKM